jgi:hypothetical protein
VKTEKNALNLLFFSHHLEKNSAAVCNIKHTDKLAASVLREANVKDDKLNVLLLLLLCEKMLNWTFDFAQNRRCRSDSL